MYMYSVLYVRTYISLYEWSRSAAKDGEWRLAGFQRRSYPSCHLTLFRKHVLYIILHTLYLQYCTCTMYMYNVSVENVLCTIMTMGMLKHFMALSSFFVLMIDDTCRNKVSNLSPQNTSVSLNVCTADTTCAVHCRYKVCNVLQVHVLQCTGNWTVGLGTCRSFNLFHNTEMMPKK